ncbi:ABC transporter ATP-binding protein/permease [Finegoldia magna]|uniref:ABC transporter ATP-binding protein/permease n=1 Tax=Finegoldia magna TaxID=1260 RepID=UPI0029016C40|nr:ABC transporter ATP-binding protein/permease [Finegoldia magna]MDU1579014.1 ABC transporter ATP-binding protein/permease [Finegoldia magna]MDU1599714.1 ABC transporter ATP-binding protein/permease [Finegoldia magna]
MINKRLIAMMKDSTKYVLYTVLLNWIGLVFNIIFVITISGVIQNIYEKKEIGDSFYISLVIMILTIIVRYFTSYNSHILSQKASVIVKKELRHKLYEKLLSFGTSYNKFVNTSELLQLAVDGIEQLEMYFGGFLPQFGYSILAPVTLFAVLMFFSPKAALVMIIAVPLIPLSIVAIMKFAKKLLGKYWGNYANLGQTFLDNVAGLTTLKIYQRDYDYEKKMDREAEDFRRITMKVLSMQLNSITVMDVIAFGGAAIGSIISIVQLVNGQISLKSAIIVILLAADFFIPLRQLGSFFHVSMNGMAASDKIFKILDSHIEERGDSEFPRELSSIKFENVDFSYDGIRNIINNLSFCISSNSITSFVGESGSGKSTVASLLLGINKRVSGKITYENTELFDIKESDLMKNVTIVSANSYIFKGSLRDNLSMGNVVSDDDMYTILKKVNLYDFFESENSLDTKINEAGSNLSGGQRQRLAIARAILKDSKVYIFDEATSNIDLESEEIIMNLINEIAKDKIVVLISHRLANVTSSEKIYVLKNGNIIEQGCHKQLISNDGLYKKMFTEQYKLENLGEI